VADRHYTKRDTLRVGTQRPLRQRPSRPRTTRPRLAARALRRDEGRVVIPRQLGTGIGKHLLTVFLDRDQIVQGIAPRLHTGGNDTGEDTGDVRTMLGGIE
jgi:hypothetical protein